MQAVVSVANERNALRSINEAGTKQKITFLNTNNKITSKF